MSGAAPRIALLGSCVTRQAFRHHEGAEPWRLDRPVHYQARTSFASLVSAPLAPPEPLLAAIADPFEQRSMRDDFQRTFWSRLSASEADLLIIDLVDERFDLLACEQDGDTRYATLNTQIDNWDRAARKRARRRFLGRLRRRLAEVTANAGLPTLGFRRLRRLSGDVNQVWQAAAANFAQRLRDDYPRLKVALHLAPLPETFEDGGPGDARRADNWWVRRPAHLVAVREMLGNYGRQLRELFPNAAVLQPPPEVHLLKRRHHWGEAPWHYGEAYYQELVKQIRAL